MRKGLGHDDIPAIHLDSPTLTYPCDDCTSCLLMDVRDVSICVPSMGSLAWRAGGHRRDHFIEPEVIILPLQV